MEAQKEATTQALPALGDHLAGGKFAGITTGKDGVPYALIVLGIKADKRMSWPDAMAFAASHDADLPSRVDGAMAFVTLPDEFEKSWHWLNEQCSPDYAWSQDFGDGYQDDDYKGNGGVVRLVRRLLINP